MDSEKVTYFIKGKKKEIMARKVSPFSSGLLFKKNSPALLFTFGREKKFSIFSVFCKPFKAIWLDKNMNATRTVDVKKWKWKISGEGKYLLEIPESLLNNKFSTEKR